MTPQYKHTVMRKYTSMPHYHEWRTHKLSCAQLLAIQWMWYTWKDRLSTAWMVSTCDLTVSFKEQLAHYAHSERYTEYTARTAQHYLVCPSCCKWCFVILTSSVVRGSKYDVPLLHTQAYAHSSWLTKCAETPDTICGEGLGMRYSQILYLELQCVGQACG